MTTVRASFVRWAVCCVLAIAIPACDSDDGASVTGPEIGPPARLAFVTQPGDVALAAPIAPAVRVAVQDSAGNTVGDATSAVALTLESNPGGARLSGTTTVEAVDGVATFDDLAIDQIATGYTLLASAIGLNAAVSDSFDVRFVLADIEAGIDHACGLTPGGAVYCWGTNGQGQFGNGEAGPDHDRPAPAADAIRFSALGAGDFHTCGLTAGGEAYCWGWDTGGQRGDGQVGTRDTVAVPTGVVGGLTFAGLSVGEIHTCGLTEAGLGYCWGNNGNGSLGDGDAPTDKGEPTPVEGGLSFVHLTAGSSHTCGLTSAGTAYCWGRNSRGQLGDGNAGADADTPVEVVGGLGFTELSAAIGSGHTCGLTADGEVYCWGDNSDGALGDGNAGTDADVPVPVETDLSFQAVSAGGGHTCGLTLEGAAHCWGDNFEGQLGDGDMGTDSDTPVPVAGGLTFEGLAMGDNFSCGWTAAGEAYCWGYNASGQLGDGNLGGDSDVPVRVLDPD